jgi:hypothetical protein
MKENNETEGIENNISGQNGGIKRRQRQEYHHRKY